MAGYAFRKSARRSTPRARVQKRRQYQPRYSKRPRAGGINKTMRLSGFPSSKMVKLKYVDTVTIDMNSGTEQIGKHVFRANSLFDPDYALGGHQPLGFDQWAAIYDHYCVVGSKITATALNVTNANGGPYRFVLRLDDTDRTWTTWSHIMEHPGTSPMAQYGHPVDAGTGHASVSQTFSAKKFFKTSRILSDDRFNSLVTANPSEDALFTLFANNASSTFDPSTVYFQIEIEYIAVFTEPRQIPQS